MFSSTVYLDRLTDSLSWQVFSGVILDSWYLLVFLPQLLDRWRQVALAHIICCSFSVRVALILIVYMFGIHCQEGIERLVGMLRIET